MILNLSWRIQVPGVLPDCPSLVADASGRFPASPGLLVSALGGADATLWAS